MLKCFQQFILRGNVLDLAVAVVMGAAFGGVVTALVKDLLTPLIAAIVGKPDFSAIAFEVNGSKFLIGDFINALVTFILIAAAVYFFVIVPVNTLMARLRRGEAPPDPTTKKCPECLSDVAIGARPCAFCRSPICRDPMEPTSRRIKEMEVMVADVILETPDTTTLVLFTGNDRLEYL